MGYVYQDSIINVVKVIDKGYDSQALFKGEDGYYRVNVRELIFDASNPEGTTDEVTPLQKEEDYFVKLKNNPTWNKHSDLGHFICSDTFLYIIFGLILGAWLLLKLFDMIIPKISVVLVSMALLTAGIIGEIILANHLGTDAVWFCIDESFSWWTRLLFTLLLAIVLGLQFMMLFTFSSDLEAYYDTEVSNKYTIISVVLCFPMLIAAALLGDWLADKQGWDRTSEDIFVLAAWLSLPLALLSVSAIKNFKGLGVMGGTIYTVFCMIYAVGLIIGVIFFAVAFFKNFIKFFIAMALVASLGAKTVKGTDGHTYVEDRNGDYKDSNGTRYRRQF